MITQPCRKSFRTLSPTMRTFPRSATEIRDGVRHPLATRLDPASRTIAPHHSGSFSNALGFAPDSTRPKNRIINTLNTPRIYQAYQRGWKNYN